MMEKTIIGSVTPIKEGYLSFARQAPSPNFNERPHQQDISLLVIHNISLPPEQFGGPYIEQFFTNQLDESVHPYFQSLADVKVSAHMLITRQGEVIQFVSCDLRAWHAGVSSFDGNDNCNDFSIGIELEGSDVSPYTDEQYQALAQVTRLLLAHYPNMTRERIAGHSDIAPGRKTDPGEYFNWKYYHSLIS